MDENGKKYVSQFRQKDDTWYYYDENGYLVLNRELDINGKHYKFTGSGAVYTAGLSVKTEHIIMISRDPA